MMALLEKECSLSGEDTQFLLAVKKNSNFFSLSGDGDSNTLDMSPHAYA